ncbi:MAG TPA: hypothetical protein VHY79_10060 [Rhizomicrobium sp.]|nr:hypothetical protein [Rhizomicrobium sp.]
MPLLKRAGADSDWEPRACTELSEQIGAQFGLPIDLTSKMGGLNAISRALNEGDIARAQIATVLLGIPDPPDLTKSAVSEAGVVETALRLRDTGILKIGWDPSKHPRWPAGGPGGIGGEFSSAGGDGGSAADNRDRASHRSSIPVEFVIPSTPFDVPLPGELSTPRPFEILPPPLAFPNTNPRDRPKNPYPRRRECVEEWEAAEDFCDKLLREGKLGPHGARGFGQWYYQCVLGQVSEDCGGNSTSA